jgi:hypothetical protein
VQCKHVRQVLWLVAPTREIVRVSTIMYSLQTYLSIPDV